MSVIRPRDVQLWDNGDGTWKITWYTDRAAQIFKQEYGVYAFQVSDEEIFKVYLLCQAHDLLIDLSLDVVLKTLRDLDGNPIRDPKLSTAP
jgi:hypothetical protein